MAVKIKVQKVREVQKVQKVQKVRKAQKISKDVVVSSYDAKGQKSTISLPEAIFGQKPNKTLLAQAVRVYLSNQRKAHAKTKGRGEVNYTTAKPFRQKGTGHARHGSHSAPIFVGGGVAHGPRGLQNYKLDLPKTLKKKALRIALSEKVAQGEVSVADLTKIEAKTKKISEVLKKAGVQYPSLLVVTKDDGLFKAARNIADLEIVSADNLTTYQVLAVKSMFLTKGAVDSLEKRLARKD